MTFPITGQTLIIKATNETQSLGSRNSNNVLPFLVAFQDFYGQLLDLAADPSVLIDPPHSEYGIYTK